MDAVMMVPYLHFTGGDNLFFQSWHPTSSGAIAGACIGLVFLALLDRWVAAARNVLEDHWRFRCVPCFNPASRSESFGRSSDTISRSPSRSCSGNDSPPPSVSEKSFGRGQIQEEPRVEVLPSSTNPSRIIPPFIPKHDISRGIIQAGQSLLGFVLMLAVM